MTVNRYNFYLHTVLPPQARGQGKGRGRGNRHSWDTDERRKATKIFMDASVHAFYSRQLRRRVSARYRECARVTLNVLRVSRVRGCTTWIRNMRSPWQSGSDPEAGVVVALRERIFRRCSRYRARTRCNGQIKNLSPSSEMQNKNLRNARTQRYLTRVPPAIP